MKEFIKNNKVTYNLMSFTAFKTLLIFSLLIEAPRSYQNIIDYFENHDFINEKIAIDTIRVYINSLKRAGCVITKTKRSEGSKFVLESHPFELTMTDDQIKTLTKVYKMISKTLDISELILLEKFLQKLVINIKNEKFAEAITRVSVLSGLDLNLLEELSSHCRKSNQIVLSYNSPRSNKTKVELICEKLGLENGKVYLYGTNVEHKQSSYFPVSRIIGVDEIKLQKNTDLKLEDITIKYEITTNLPELQLKSFEKLLSTDKNKTIIEATYSNKFVLTQRILSFGSNCKVLEPKSFVNEIVETLKQMRAGY